MTGTKTLSRSTIFEGISSNVVKQLEPVAMSFVMRGLQKLHETGKPDGH